jgi:hypothetical protein
MRCLGCGSSVRLVAFSGGRWAPWNGVDSFVEKHLEKCHGYRADDVEQSNKGYSFFEIVNEKDMKVSEVGFVHVNEMLRDPERLM